MLSESLIQQSVTNKQVTSGIPGKNHVGHESESDTSLFLKYKLPTDIWSTKVATNALIFYAETHQVQK
jgi:hypothetical protein